MKYDNFNTFEDEYTKVHVAETNKINTTAVEQ